MTLWTLAICIELLRNLFLIVGRKRKPNYAQSFVIRFFGGLSVLIIEYPYFPESWLTLWQASPFVVFQITSFYLAFDPLIALILGRPNPLTYRGKDSGYLDKLPMWAYYSLKILCLAGLILSLIALI